MRLFSMVKEKDYKEAIRLLCREGSWDEIILTKISDNKRALEMDQLEQCFREETDSTVLVIEEPELAYTQALAHRKPGQKLFCTGSLYLIGELKKIAGGCRSDQF